jgi:hypothetical protein
MTKKQIEETAKLSIDLGKLTFASLIFGFFQSNLDPLLIISFSFIGLTLSAGFFILGLKLIKET